MQKSLCRALLLRVVIQHTASLRHEAVIVASKHFSLCTKEKYFLITKTEFEVFCSISQRV